MDVNEESQQQRFKITKPEDDSTINTNLSDKYIDTIHRGGGKAFIDEDDEDPNDYKEKSLHNNKEEESNDSTNNIKPNIPTSKSAQQLNQLPRVKFLSDYDMNQNDNNKENVYQPLISTKDSVIEMNNADSWLDEKGLIIKDKSKPSDHKKESNEKINEPAKKSAKPIKVHYYKNSKSVELIFNLGGGEDSRSKETGCFTQLTYLSFYQALIAELLGTYLLVLYVCSFGMPKSSTSEHASITGSIGSGFIVATLVWTLANVSGSNLNPAVSIALLVTGETNLVRVLFYIPCQLLGSVLAVLTLKELNNSDTFIKVASIASNSMNNTSGILADTVKSAAPLQIGLTTLNKNITAYQGFTVELIITFILVMTIFACIDKKRTDLGGSFPLTIGFAICVGALFGGKFTGGSMNPARSFGPALIENHWQNHWVYWFGPISGAIIGAYVYKTFIFRPKISKT